MRCIDSKNKKTQNDKPAQAGVLHRPRCACAVFCTWDGRRGSVFLFPLEIRCRVLRVFRDFRKSSILPNTCVWCVNRGLLGWKALCAEIWVLFWHLFIWSVFHQSPSSLRPWQVGQPLLCMVEAHHTEGSWSRWPVCSSSQENACSPNRVLLGIWKGELHLSRGQYCALMKAGDKVLGPTVQPTEASFEHLLGGGPMASHLLGRPWDTGQSRSTARILILTQSYHQLLWAALFWEFFHWSTREGEAMLVYFLSAMEKYRQQGSARWGLRCRVAPPTPLGIHESLTARWFPKVLPGTWWGGFHTL